MTAPQTVRNSRKHRRALALEQMEARQMLAGNIFAVTNNGDQGGGTLRDAIDQVNATPGASVIQFQLPLGQTTIAPLTALPQITSFNVTVDAETQQPGYKSGKPVVVLSGALAPINTPGLQISGGNALVKGLVINGWQGVVGSGLVLSGPRDIVVGCFIGTDVTGKIAVPNGGNGIDISNGNDTIGGTTVAARNIISGNSFQGIQLTGPVSSGIVILGNYIGVATDGITKLGNGFSGIQSTNAVGNQIGGVVPGSGNVISNNFVGIAISGNVTTTTVQGNFIGTDSTGTIAEGNTFDGISVSGSKNIIGTVGSGRNVISANGRAGISINGAPASNNTIQNNAIGVASNGTSPLGNATQGIVVNGANNEVIGGVLASQGNIIAYNGSLFKSDGVQVQSGMGVEILSNSIFSNAGLGIHLSKGANGDQVAPVLTSAQEGAGQTNVVGQLIATPNSQYIIQYFSNPTADPSGFGQGQVYLGSIAVTTDGSGFADVSTRLTSLTNIGDVITATATVPAGVRNTSAFAADIPITAAPVTNLQVSIVPNPSGAALLGATESYTVTVKNTGPNPATGVVVNNTVDNNSTVATPLPANSVIDPLNPQNVITTIGNLAVNASVSYTVLVTPNDVGTISITSTVSNNEIDANLNPSATVTLPVNPAADLAISLIPSPAPVPVGSLLTYILTVTNNGPSIANNVVATENLPANSTLNTDTISPSQGSIAIAQDGLTITFNAGILPVGASATLTLQVTPSQVGSVTTTASVSATEADTNQANNMTSVTTAVDNSADLSVSVASSPTIAFVNQNLTYVVTVTNQGPSAATGAFLTDVLPAGVTFVSATTSQGGPAVQSNGVVTAPLGTIANGGTATVTILVTPIQSGSLTNTATVSNTTANEIDTVSSNNTTVQPAVLVSPVSLGISLVGSPEPVVLGNNLTYVLDVHNGGPADATNVTVSDLLPQGLNGVDIVSITPSQGGTPNNVGGLITQNLGTIPSGQDATVTIVVTPKTSTLLISIATIISDDQINTNAANNTATAMNTVSPADIAVQLTSSTSTPIVGNPFTYAINFENGGPSAANGFLLTDIIPAGLTVTGTSSTIGGTPAAVRDSNTGTTRVTLQISQLASGGSGTVTINVTPTQVISGIDTATVTSTNYDPHPENNQASVALTAINLPGTFQFATSGYSVSETGGSVNLTVTRTNGNQGAVVLRYTTVNGTAVAGVNFAGANSAIVFNPGETSKTITIPIIHDNQITPNLNFQVALTGSSSGGGVVGGLSTANVTVVNVDRDTVSPLVTSVTPLTNGKVIYGIVVGFSKQLDPARASNPANYAIFASGRDGKAGSPNVPVQVSAAYYNDQNHTVTLVPAVLLSLGKFYGVAVNGSTAGAIADLSGNTLSGNGSGAPGSDFDSFFAIGTNLSYVDSSGSTVNLRLTDGGTMYLTRFANGQGNVLQLLGVVPGRSRLSGSVHHTKTSLSYTTINTINGLGSFGSVHSSLTTPSFYVLTPTNVSSAVSFPTVGSKVPVGPARLSRSR